MADVSSDNELLHNLPKKGLTGKAIDQDAKSDIRNIKNCDMAL